MHKIFSQNKLIIIDSPESRHGGITCKYNGSAQLFKDYLSFTEDTSSTTLVIEHSSPDEVWIEFQKHFRLIEAAGGVVKNFKSETLMIFRNDKWDLPKGKIEKNEQIEAAALREVEEECGIKNISIAKPLPTTFHTYILKGKHILKKTYWFVMDYSGTNEKLVPQIEEGITEVKWMTSSDIKKVAENTYPLIRAVLDSH